MNLKQKIKDITTFHNDDGTSGYLLTEEQVDKILRVIELEFKEWVKKYEKDSKTS